MKISQTDRVLLALKQLSLGQKVCTKSLAAQFDESDRNIQRDLSILKNFLKEALIPCERGCYQLLSTSHFTQLIQQDKSSKELRNFFEFMTLVDTGLLDLLDGKEFGFIEQIKKDTSTIYTILDDPIEALKNITFFEQMKEAVKTRRYCDIIYDEKGERTLKNIQPQKILYANNNWYLAAMTENYKPNNGFKLFRINYIKEFTLQPSSFHTDRQAQDHIRNMQSLFEDYLSISYEVRLKVSKEASRFFKVKQYLCSQKIEKENADGSLVVSFTINNDMELLPLIRRWIPHLKVLSPISLQEKIKLELKTYLDDI